MMTLNPAKNPKSIKFSQAVLMYVKLKQAQVIYNQKDWDKSAQTMFEYSVDMIVDEDTADEWDAMFPKQSAKKVLKKDFMKTYKIEKDEEFPKGVDPKLKKFYVIKLKQNTHYEDKNGVVQPLSKETRPRLVYINEDGKKVDGTLTVEVGNGSVGDVLVSVRDNGKYGLSCKLKAILVTDLIEYTSGGSKDLDDFFGDNVELVDLPDESFQTKEDEAEVLEEENEDDTPPFDEGVFEEEEEDEGGDY